MSNFKHYKKIEQGSSRWFDLRTGRFSASNAWRLIFDKKPTQTTEDYILKKLTETIYKTSDASPATAAMQWGIDHEDLAAMQYFKRSGNWIDRAGVFVSEHCAASPDRLAGQSGLLEIKCPFSRHNHIKLSLIQTAEQLKKEQKAYYWQIQFQLWATGRKWCDFVSFDPRLLSGLDPSLALSVLRVFPNLQDIEKLMQCAKVAINRKMELYKKLHQSKIVASTT